MPSLDLGKQIGPLPLGAWFVVVATGLGIAVWNRRNNSPVEVEDTSGVPGVGTGAVGGMIPTTPTAPTEPTPTAPTTNEEWGQRAITWLIGQNYDATLSDSAIRKYLAGMQPSVSERVLIGMALARFGAPPQLLPPVDESVPPSRTPIVPPPPSQAPPPVRPAPTPPAPPPVSRPSVRYYTVVKNDNLWNISKRYYGTGLKWGAIYNANRAGKRRSDGSMGMIVNPSLIYPKWRLIIP